MMEKKEAIKWDVEALFEMLGKDDAALVVAHINEPSACVKALRGAGANIIAALACAMKEHPDLLIMMKVAIMFAESKSENKNN